MTQDQINKLAEQYKVAHVQMLEANFGSKASDRAHERIERIVLKADAAGVLDEFLVAAGVNSG